MLEQLILANKSLFFQIIEWIECLGNWTWPLRCAPNNIFSHFQISITCVLFFYPYNLCSFLWDVFRHCTLLNTLMAIRELYSPHTIFFLSCKVFQNWNKKFKTDHLKKKLSLTLLSFPQAS